MGAILGYIIAMGLSMLGMVGFVSMANHSVENIRTSATAGQLIVFDKAVAQYVSDYASTIAEVATSTTPADITPAMLINTGYLPSGFSSKNPFGQTWLAQVLQPSSGELETLVTSQSGTAISNQLQLVQIAAQAGAQGGFIPYASQGGDTSLVATTAQGSYGGWSLAMTNFTNPGSGHLASLLAFQSLTTNTNYLYRVAVSGQPQLNAMQTDLSMEDTSGTAHSISGANLVKANELVTPAGVGVVMGSSKLYGDSTNTVSYQNGALYSENAAGTAYAGVVGSALIPGTAYTAGSACGNVSAWATNGTDPLYCKGGVWTTLSAGMQFYSISTSVGDFSGGTVLTYSPYSWVPYGTYTATQVYGEIDGYGGSSTASTVYIRWLNSSGAVIRDWTLIGGVNVRNGSDGGSGMRDDSSFTMPLWPGTYYIQFYNPSGNPAEVTLNGFSAQ